MAILEELQEGENIQYQGKPSSAILLIWFFTKCLLLAFIVAWLLSIFMIPAGIFGGLLGLFRPSLIGTIITFSIIIIFSIGLGFVYCIFLRRTYEYYITDQRVVFKGGIIIRTRRSVPFYKITDITVSQNIVERLLGISSLHIQTAGMGMGRGPFIQSAEICFVGLVDPDVPERILSEILKRYRARALSE